MYLKDKRLSIYIRIFRQEESFTRLPHDSTINIREGSPLPLFRASTDCCSTHRWIRVMLERANNKPILYSTVNSVILLHRRMLASPGIYRPNEHSDAAVTRRRILLLPPLPLPHVLLLVAPEADKGSLRNWNPQINFPERKSRNCFLYHAIETLLSDE